MTPALKYDLALGRLVEAVSHSPYWRSTVIITVEDDAQDGPDHVDAHRAPSLVISPWTQADLPLAGRRMVVELARRCWPGWGW